MNKLRGVSLPRSAEKRLTSLVKSFPADAGHWLAAWIDSPESVVDTGVARAISTPNAVASHPAWGALFETAVYAEIRKAVTLMSPRPVVHHWRTGAGAEVDLLLERDDTFFPIEVKAASRPSRRDTTGITAFRKTYPKLGVARGLVVAPGEELEPLSESDWAMPWDAVAPAPAGPARRDARRRGPFPKGEAEGRLGGAESDT